MHDHLITHFGHLAGRIAGGSATSVPAGLVVDSGLDCDTFNVAVSDDGSAAPTREEASDIVAGYGGRAFSWWVGPGAPPGLPARLLELGLTACPPETAMALDLSAPGDDGASTPLTIETVATARALAAYAEVLAANWSPSDANVTRFYAEAQAAALAAASPLVLLLGVARGVPVATAEVAIGSDGVGGLYNVATLAAHRRQGFGAAMTTAAIRAAMAHGLRRLELQSSDEGLPVYERLGFRSFGAWTEFQPPA